MPRYKHLVLLAFAISMHLVLKAQTSVAATSSNSNNDGFMRSEGKIYVVMAVVITILAGILLYMVRLDRKISKLEKGDNA